MELSWVAGSAVNRKERKQRMRCERKIARLIDETKKRKNPHIHGALLVALGGGQH